MVKLGWVLVSIAAAFLLWRLLQGGVPVYAHEIVAQYPHDERAYSQGLLFHDGVLYESTGRNGSSSVRKVDLETGKVLQRTDLPFSLFGEGLALHDDRLIQLTWQAGIARIYDRKTLAYLDKIEYQGEGWGLTSDGTHLILSDGSDVLRFVDPKTFREVRRLHVHTGDGEVQYLNELEYVKGEIYANIWKSDYIARIDPETGEVRGWIDLVGLFDYRALPDPESVLNGIAYDPDTDRLFVTGKLWPVLFEIDLSQP